MIVAPSPSFIAHVVFAVVGSASLVFGIAAARRRSFVHALAQSIGVVFVTTAALVAIGSVRFDQLVIDGYERSFDGVVPSPSPTRAATTSASETFPPVSTTFVANETTAPSTAELSSFRHPVPFFHSERKRHAPHARHAVVHATLGVALVGALVAQAVLGAAAHRSSSSDSSDDGRGRSRRVHRRAGYALGVALGVQLALGVAAATDACTPEHPCALAFGSAIALAGAAVGYRRAATARRRPAAIAFVATLESAALVVGALVVVLEAASEAEPPEHPIGAPVAIIGALTMVTGVGALVRVVRTPRSAALDPALARGVAPALVAFVVGVASLVESRSRSGDLERASMLQLGMCSLVAAVTRGALAFNALAVFLLYAAVAVASGQFTAVRAIDDARPSIWSVLGIQWLVICLGAGAWLVGERACARVGERRAPLDDVPLAQRVSVFLETTP